MGQIATGAMYDALRFAGRAFSIISYHHTSFGPILILFKALFKTTTCSIEEERGIALSTTFFNSISFPLLKPPSAVITTFEFESFTLSDNACVLKPENTTVCIAPILAHANIAIGSSGTMGR